jgi:hypothetical protein
MGSWRVYKAAEHAVPQVGGFFVIDHTNNRCVAINCSPEDLAGEFGISTEGEGIRPDPHDQRIQSDFEEWIQEGEEIQEEYEAHLLATKMAWESGEISDREWESKNREYSCLINVVATRLSKAKE